MATESIPINFETVLKEIVIHNPIKIYYNGMFNIVSDDKDKNFHSVDPDFSDAVFTLMGYLVDKKETLEIDYDSLIDYIDTFDKVNQRNNYAPLSDSEKEMLKKYLASSKTFFNNQTKSL